MVEVDLKENIFEYRTKNFKNLKFGTSGIRDEDSKLTDLQIYISTKGFLNYLFKLDILKGGTEVGTKVAIAGDFRPSTYRILVAVTLAIIDSGCFVDYCGKIPTPAIFYHGFSNKIPSLMVTGSHNPYGQNGVKFNKCFSEVLKDDEKGIMEEIAKVRETEYKKISEESIFGLDGNLKKFEELNIIDQYKLIDAKKYLREENINNLAKENYITRYEKAFGKILSNERVVFFQQTAIGREIVPEILKRLGCYVFLEGKLDENKEFLPVDTEDMKPYILEKMTEYAIKNKCSVCITTDGDSDRPAIVFVRKDKNGNFLYKDGKPIYHYIKGDKLNVLACILLKPDFVSVPISTNHKSINLLRKLGIEVKLTRVGSPYVIKAMNDRLESEKIKYLEQGRYISEKEILEKIGLYAFEVNGGGLRGSNKPLPLELFKDIENNNDLGKLEMLSTRDAVLPIICSLILAHHEKLSLEELVRIVFSNEHESHTHSGLVENLPGVSVTPGCEEYNSDVGKSIINLFKIPIDNLSEIEFFVDNISFKDEHEKTIQIREFQERQTIKLREILIEYFKELLELDKLEIIKINYLDGIRIYLSHGEIIHLRPSGNSAQFRIYVEAKTEERAMEIVEKAIKGEQGFLVKLIQDHISGNLKI